MTGKLKDVPGSLGTGDGGGTGGGTGGGDTTGNQVIDEIITAAKNQLGKPYLLGAEGPAKYDCSGLVDYCFRTTGNYALIGSARKRAAGYAHWFADHGHYTTDLSKRGPGDLIAFAHPGKGISHIAINLPSGRILSALINPQGVSITRLNGLNIPPVGVCRVQYPNTTAAAFTAELAPGPLDVPESAVETDPNAI